MAWIFESKTVRKKGEWADSKVYNQFAAGAHATVAFEPWHGTFRARVVLDDHTPIAMQKCVARVGRS